MKAAEKPRINLEDRTSLEEVIPLRTPFVVFVDPSDACNFSCKFCPTGNRDLVRKAGRRPQLMPLDLYRKIIDDLADLDEPLKVLRLYKDGEPLLNPHFAEMVRYAKERGVARSIDTTTNASLLTVEKGIEIIDAGLDRINISIEGMTAGQYREFSSYVIDFDRLVENISSFYEHKGSCELCIKVNGDILSEEEKHRFYNVFGDIADRIFIEHIAPCWPEFEMEGVSVNMECGIYGQEIQAVAVCPYIFYSLAINSDGRVSLCFLDWARKLIIGDMKKGHFMGIWNGAKLHHYRELHLRKERTAHPVCGQCGQLSHCLADNIDAHADSLLKKISDSRK